MDPLISLCQNKLESFRVKELKDVLTRIGAAKQGKRQVLIDKIMAVIQSSGKQQFGTRGLRPESSTRRAVTPEEVAKIIDDVYRKMRSPGAPDLATSDGSLASALGPLQSLNSEVSIKQERTEKVRCPCGNKMKTNSMIQCDNSKCNVWQHINCVIIPEKEGLDVESPAVFYCELCRLQLGDPYRASVSHPLLPTKLMTSLPSSEGSNPVQKLNKSFILSQTDRDLIWKPQYDLQIWSMLLNDKAIYRMHWPLQADLSVNGYLVRVTNRPGHQSLGINGRDDGVVITDYVRDGNVNISLSASDGRPFVIGIRVMQHLTVDQVLSRIPSESEGESFDTALARVRRCLSGGGKVDNDNDSDSDIEVIAGHEFVNLRCPMSGSRMKIAGRFKKCVHMGGFDLHTFVELNKRTRKWQCPVCLANYTLEDLIIDPFLTRIVEAMQSYGEDVTEVEMKPDGSWRPKVEGDSKQLELWRTPDGTYEFNGNKCQDRLQTVKVEEDLPIEKVSLKIGIKRTRDGTWQVKSSSVYSHDGTCEPNNTLTNTEYYQRNSTTMNETEISGFHQGLQSLKMVDTDVTSRSTVTSKLGTTGLSTVELEPTKDAEVIVLSDSEEEIDEGCILRDVNDAEMTNHQENEVDVPFLEAAPFQEVAVDFFQPSRQESDRFINSWPSQVQNSPYDILSSPNILRKPRSASKQTGQHLNNGLSSQHQRQNSTADGRVLDYDVQRQYQGRLFENDRELCSSDQSLYMFLPQQPARPTSTYGTYESSAAAREDIQRGWISLGVGSDQRGSAQPSTTVNSGYSGEQDSPERFNPVVDPASVLLKLSSQGAPANVRGSSNVGSHRSVHRQRRYYPVESDSEG